MKNLTILATGLLFSLNAFSWGQNGHRIVAKIAQDNLTPRAAQAVDRILDGKENLPMVANWPDFIKSDPKYDYTKSWHFVSVDNPNDDLRKYERDDSNVIGRLRVIIQNLRRTPTKFDLKFLVHLVGDVHQPLHVGYTNDLGGNKIDLRWFSTDINLHQLWDEHLVDHQQLSYTEYVEFLHKEYKSKKSSWERDDLLVWAKESINMRPVVYSYPERPYRYWEYEYNYRSLDAMNMRLYQGGVRLAYILNTIFR